ncbi:hypothetical protein [Solidesulfovibrio alcoholivorans]|uniref:hypothetical protein n=1 Tax=Solidesulfovibrio alcoholivorans TaxID=81406 RepID=UPI000497A4C6|nr:hypothetical protein [Solidesulfovibrio alcoholivorans]
MQGAHPFFTYTGEILAWRLGEERNADVSPSPAPDAARVRAWAGRILRAARDAREIVLLGLGSGAVAGALARSLPDDKVLTVLSPDPAAARRLAASGGLDWRTPDGQARLLADTSRQALYCLPALAGFDPARAVVVANPESGQPHTREALAWVRRMLTASVPLPDAPYDAARPAPAPPDVTLAVLVQPQETGLEEFFAACAGLAHSAVLCWDAAAVPRQASLARALGMPVRHLARPLAGDFAAQRNALLAACPPGWVLTLDPDERPAPGMAQTIARVTRAPDIGGVFFPRLTLYPDQGHAKVGHGLWPDLQLRLFHMLPPASPRYVRPVHERLEGLAGRAALALDTPLFHYNRLLADEGAVKAKLAAYDAAAGQPRHHLSSDYPSLPLAFFSALSGDRRDGRVLLLPPLW